MIQIDLISEIKFITFNFLHETQANELSSQSQLFEHFSKNINIICHMLPLTLVFLQLVCLLVQLILLLFADYNQMRIIVNFSPQIGLASIEKDVSPNETVENLEILISLSYDKMSECKLVYQEKSLNNKSEPLRSVLTGTSPVEITVTTKNELEAYAEQVGSIMQLFQQYPTYFVGGIVIIIFLVLFLMGG